MRRTWAAAAALVGVISVSFYIAAVRYREAKALRNPPKLNYLVLSFCSLRDDFVNRDLMPNVDSFFSVGGFRFLNAVNPNPWTAIFHYNSKSNFRLPLNDLGYEVLGFDTKGYKRINGKNIAGSLAEFKKDLLKPRTHPFVAVAHLSFMHYPYQDPLGAWKQALSPTELGRVEGYLKDPAANPDKLPFLMILSGDPALAGTNPKTSAAYRSQKTADQMLGLITNPELLKDWRASEGYDQDVLILRKIYAAQASRLDELLKEVFNFWGDRKLQEQTAIFFMGDHGEMLGEHNEISHAAVLFDGALKFPMLMRFPKQTGGLQTITEQVQLETAAKILELAMAGAINDLNLTGYVKTLSEDVLVLRDCANKWRGLRVKNDWKYLVRLGDDEKFLFDLRKDPGENENLAARSPGETMAFEQEYWQNYARFAALPARHCTPTPAAE